MMVAFTVVGGLVGAWFLGMLLKDAIVTYRSIQQIDRLRNFARLVSDTRYSITTVMRSAEYQVLMQPTSHRDGFYFRFCLFLAVVSAWAGQIVRGV